MSAEWLDGLLHLTVLLSLALLLVLALRPLWLRAFGPGSVRILWLCVPAVLLAAQLPAPVVQVPISVPPSNSVGVVPVVDLARGASPALQLEGSIPFLAGNDDHYISLVLLSLWLLGVLGMAARLVLQQRRFRYSLGRLQQRPDGSYISEFSTCGPALVGALRPRIVLPADFEIRYDTDQQSLILAHERCHLRRGDAQFTLLACAIRCVFWFNPLVHLAWTRFRFDQELSCDAEVLRDRPDARRRYAEAMLSTQLADPGLPAGCTWQSSHPLKRRIAMLYFPRPHRVRLLAGMLLAVGASSASALGAWNSLPARVAYTSEAVVAVDTDRKPPPVMVAPAPMAPVASVAPTARVAGPTPVAPPKPPEPSAPVAPPTEEAVSRSKGQAPVASARTSRTTPAPQVRETPAAPPTASVQSSMTSAMNAAPQLAMNGSAPRAVARNAGSSRQLALADARTSSEYVAYQAPRVVEASMPAFPRTVWSPELISYPGHPDQQAVAERVVRDPALSRLEVRVSLDPNGTLQRVAISQSELSNQHERAALRAVRQWRFEPARIDGQTVASEVLLPFVFHSAAALSVVRDDRTPVIRNIIPQAPAYTTANP